MEKVAVYREIIRRTLLPLTERKYSVRDVQNEAVFDATNDRYLIMSVGWEGSIRRIHGCLAHLDIINGKVWIQRDGTEDGCHSGNTGKQGNTLESVAVWIMVDSGVDGVCGIQFKCHKVWCDRA